MSLVTTVQYEKINFLLYDAQKYDFWLYNTEKIKAHIPKNTKMKLKTVLDISKCCNLLHLFV
jgi:hypothetical protein